jgi:hypothetical protein
MPERLAWRRITRQNRSVTAAGRDSPPIALPPGIGVRAPSLRETLEHPHAAIGRPDGSRGLLYGWKRLQELVRRRTPEVADEP